MVWSLYLSKFVLFWFLETGIYYLVSLGTFIGVYTGLEFVILFLQPLTS